MVESGGAEGGSQQEASHSRRKRKAVYTTGELNKLVDSAIHPLAEKNPILWFVDGVLHAAIEQDPS